MKTIITFLILSVLSIIILFCTGVSDREVIVDLQERVIELENKKLMTENLYMDFHQSMLEFNEFWEENQKVFSPAYKFNIDDIKPDIKP